MTILTRKEYSKLLKAVNIIRRYNKEERVSPVRGLRRYTSVYEDANPCGKDFVKEFYDAIEKAAEKLGDESVQDAKINDEEE